MEETNKHNIFSKEELFKLIDEKKSLPPEADDFDREAMEGLAMVTNGQKLETLNESIDEVLLREAKKASKKRNMYYFAAAASLMLVVGLFFLVKDNVIKDKETGLAENTIKTEQTPPTTKEVTGAEEKKVLEAPAAMQPANGEAKGKEVLKTERKLSEEIASKNQETFAADVTTVKAPADEAESKLTLAEITNEKSNSGAGGVPKVDANIQDGKKAGGKSGKNDKAADDADEEQKRELAKKGEDKYVYKEKADEKDKKVRYETNTVWTSTGTTESKDKQVVADELKQKAQTQTETKPGTTNDNRTQTVNGTVNNATVVNAPVQTQSDVVVTGGETDQSKAPAPQKSAEVVSAMQKVNQGPFSKKYRAKKRAKSSAQFGDSGNTPAESSRAAGYAYYAQSSTRSFTSPEFIGGDDALQKFVKENLKISSPDKTGTIVAEFLVKKDGSVDANDIKIITPIKNCDTCSKDVTELVKNMPKWKPANENGQGKEYRQKLSVLYHAKMSKK